MTGPLNTDYFETLNQLANKMLNHTHKHLEYGQFIMQGGLKLNSDWLSKMSDAEIKVMLDQHPELKVVGLFDQKHAIGGFEIKALTNPSIEKIAEARAKGLTIIPYHLYASAAEAINNYHYNTTFGAIWGKVISLYKQGWLMNPGVIVRNFIDSGLKNIAEGESIPDTLRNYINANTLLNKYDQVVYEIKMYDSIGRYRLENAEKYFNLPNRLMDKDTFHFLYDFLEDSGISSLSTEQNLFSRLMKPNADVERLARLTQYLTLENQGLDYAQIINKIAKTHFDYNTKTYADFIASEIIPFWTFITNNINYVAHLIEDNPSFLRNFFNVYTPIWDFDSLDYEELASNQSLQYQILNGNLPLKMFGYKDKELTRTVNTKNGPKQQKVTNTATLRIGSSILDGLQFFVNPLNSIKEKLAPPMQMIMDTSLEFGHSALGNSERFKWMSQQDTEKNYQMNFGSTSIQNLFKDPTNIVSLTPYLNSITQRYMHKIYSDSGNSYAWGSSTGERTQNPILGTLPSIFGATSRWGEFINTPKSYKRSTYSYPKYNYTKIKTYYKKPYYSNYKFRTYTSGKYPNTAYRNFMYNSTHPNYGHNNVSYLRRFNPKSIPQYLHSNYGRNRYGKSKIKSWLNMNSRYRTKTTLRRQANGY